MEEKLTALIVDDEEDVCFLLNNILRNKNLQSVCVNTLGEARKELGKASPSVIFLDNHLPDGFGMNFISEIKQKAPETKIVMITAHDTANDRERAFREGVDQFIGKPFTRGNIISVLEEIF